MADARQTVTKQTWATAPEVVKFFGEELAKIIIEDATAFGQIKTHECGLGSTVTFYLVRSEIDTTSTTSERPPLQ
jgi:hypothetical protein